LIHKKTITLLLFTSLLGTSLYAQDADMIRYKYYKEKQIQHAVQKNMKKEEKVSKGIKSKLQKGQIADENFLNSGSMINTNKYENIKNTDIYRVQDRIFRISRKTREILEILK
jgi:hypothetical protein